MFIKKLSILFLFILAFGASGCTIVKNNSGSAPITASMPLSKAEKKILPEDIRDNQRISDIMNISAALEVYAKGNNGQYPKMPAPEKISDEDSNVFQALKSVGILKNVLKDPLPDKYYYGYNSDGFSYELTAVLENQSSGRCTIAGNYCLYKFKKGEVKATPTPEAGQ